MSETYEDRPGGPRNGLSRVEAHRAKLRAIVDGLHVVEPYLFSPAYFLFLKGGGRSDSVLTLGPGLTITDGTTSGSHPKPSPDDPAAIRTGLDLWLLMTYESTKDEVKARYPDRLRWNQLLWAHEMGSFWAKARYARAFLEENPRSTDYVARFKAGGMAALTHLVNVPRPPKLKTASKDSGGKVSGSKDGGGKGGYARDRDRDRDRDRGRGRGRGRRDRRNRKDDKSKGNGDGKGDGKDGRRD